MSGDVLHPIGRQVAEVEARLPGGPAVGSWTYGELERAAGDVARRLRAAGPVRGRPVGVLLPRSPELVACYLGIWKAGGYAVLLDPDWPAERARLALAQAGADLLLTGEDLADLGQGPAAPPVEVPLDAPAYVVFTSGSTGRPKGVVVTHRSIAHSAWTHRVAHRIEAADRSAWLAPAGTSSAVGEIWPYLAAGASVHPAPAELLGEPARLQSWLLDERITKVYVSMPLAERLYRLPWPEATPLALMTVGSDAVRLWPDAGLPFEVAVSFGSAEANGVSTGLVPWQRRLTSATANAAHRAARPPVGRAWPEVRLHVVGPDLAGLPPGRIGELLVGSPEVAQGYVRDPALTAVRFIPDPFGGEPGARLLRTGDLCSLDDDGLLAHHGRRDRQIKILGMRVDPAETEAALLTLAGVHEAAVVGEPGRGGLTRLVAYLVCDPGVTATGLRSAIAERLPRPAVPARWVRLGRIPQTAGGKVDRDALPQAPGRPLPQAAARTDSGTAQLTALLPIWRRELDTDLAGPDDDFFDLGGNSLVAADLVEAIEAELSIRLRMRDVFTHRTARRLSARLTELAARPMEVV
jgi:amino acid adenylation domain-containing protein